MMPRFGLATINHSPLHGLPTQWQAHLDAAAAAGFDALAPDVFWLRALEQEGISIESLAREMRARGLACMEIAGIAIGSEEDTQRELVEHLRYARILEAEFVNTRIVVPIDGLVIDRLRRCVIAFQQEAARDVGTRVALEFSNGSSLKGIAQTREMAAAIGEEGVGVTLDTWHFFLHPDGPDWAALEALPIEALANIQLSDGVAYEAGEFRQATMDRRRMPFDGSFDLKRAARFLATRGFDGPVVVEVLSAEERARPLGDFADRALRSARDWWASGETTPD